MSQAHRLVVVGGGAGGLELISTLGKIKEIGKNSKIKITLIDGRPTHIWKPLLHEVATGSFNSGQDEINYFSNSSENNYHYVLGWVGGVDPIKKTVILDPLKVNQKRICGQRSLPYDTLVLAVGSVPDTFKTPGAREHCFFLNSPQDADKLRLAILVQGLSVLYDRESTPKLRIGIVGGGATGVELAAEIHRTFYALKMTGFKMEDLEITVLEAGPRILGMGEPKLSKLATQELVKRGVEVRTGTVIKGVNEKGFLLGDGTLLEKEIRVWAAGIRGPRWLTNDTGLETTKQSRILVDAYLKSINQPDVFAIGDCACAPLDPGKGPDKGQPQVCVPATAQAAHQEAMWLCTYLEKRLLGKEREASSLPPFHYNNHGFLVSLGDSTAVGSLAVMSGITGYQVQGHIAKGLYLTLYRKHQAVIFGYPKMISLFLGDRFHYFAMPELKFH